MWSQLMPDVAERTPDLIHARESIDAFLEAADRCESTWATPVAPGKWSPAQIVEHVARAWEEAAKDIRGESSRMMQVPAPLRLVTRFAFRRVIQRDALFKAKTNKAMNPGRGPESPTAGRDRLEAAWREFESTRRGLVGPARSRVFGRVKVEDYIRFQAIHTLHHAKQLPARP
jgi:hypothetical protein